MCLALLLSSCGPTHPDASHGQLADDVGQVLLSLTAPGIAPGPLPAQCTLSGDGMTDMVLPLTVQDGRANAEFARVPAGTRTIRVTVEHQGKISYEGSTTLSILAGKTAEAQLTLVATEHSPAMGGVSLHVQVNHAPVITGLASTPMGPAPGTAVTLLGQAQDRDGDAKLQYRWQVDAGSLRKKNTPQAVWTTPEVPGRYQISLQVTDSLGASVEAHMEIEVRGEAVSPS